MMSRYFLVIVVSVLLMQVSFSSLCGARPTGPAYPVERLAAASVNSTRDVFPFPETHIRSALLLPDQILSMPPTTTTTTTTSSSTSTSTSTTTSSTTTFTSSSTTTSTTSSTSTSSTTENATTDGNESTTTSSSSSSGNVTSSSSTTTTNSTSMPPTSSSSSSTSTSTPTTTTSSSTEMPSSTTTTITTPSSSTSDPTTTTSSSSAPVRAGAALLTYNLSNFNNKDVPGLSDSAIEHYQVVILTQSRLFALRLDEFSSGAAAASVPNRFDGSREVWSVGDKVERSYKDGDVDPEVSSMGWTQAPWVTTPKPNPARLLDPVSFQPISGRSRQRFPFPILRGFLVLEKSLCALRFVNFDNNGLLDNGDGTFSAVSGGALRHGSLRASPSFVTTVVGPGCRSDDTNHLSAPTAITRMTSGGLFLVADGTCVRALSGFSRPGTGIRSEDSSRLANSSAAENNGRQYSAVVDTIAGDCANGGAANGNALKFARFFQIADVIFDAETEAVLFIVQSFGYVRKMVPMPRRERDIATVKKTAVVATITASLGPGEVQHLLLFETGGVGSAADLSFFIVSPLGNRVTNATSIPVIDAPPLFLDLSAFPALQNNAGQPSLAGAGTRSVVPLPNGSLLVFNVRDTEAVAAPAENSRSFFVDTPVMPDLRGHLHRMQRLLYLVPAQADSASLSPSYTIELSPSASMSKTLSASVSFPSHDSTRTVSFHDSSSASLTLSRLSNSAPSNAMSPSRSQGFSRTASDTPYAITPSVSETVFFFRPRSMIPPSVMYTFINRVTLSAGFWGTVTGANPAAALMGSRIVSIIDSCACPSLQVTKTDPTLVYWKGMAYGISDSFEWEIPMIDDLVHKKKSSGTASSIALNLGKGTSALTGNSKEDGGGNGEDASADNDDSDISPTIGRVLKQERILPRIRAVIVMHVCAALVLGPPFMLGLRVVDSFVAGDGMPAAFRVGLLSVVASLWLQGGISASVSLMLLTPSKQLESLIVVGPHLLFCLLFVGILPVRMIWNALHVEPRPQLEAKSYADEDEALLEERKQKKQEKENQKRLAREKKMRKKEHEEAKTSMNLLTPNEMLAKAAESGGTETAAAAAAATATATAASTNASPIKHDKDEDDDGNDDEDEDRNSTTTRIDIENREDESIAVGAAAVGSNGGKKKDDDERLLSKIRNSWWTRFSRWSYGPVGWVPPFNTSFPRSFPLVQPFLAPSPTSFYGWLYMVHVIATIGIAIVDGFRFAKSLSTALFTVECTWFYEISSAIIYVVLALVVIGLQIWQMRRDPTPGPFISPLSSIGHFIAVVFAAIAKCLQVCCSFPEAVALFADKDNPDLFRARIVSAADFFVLIATLGLFMAVMPFFFRAFDLMRSRLRSCGVDTQVAEKQAHRRSAAELHAEETEQERLQRKELERQLSRKGELWRMLDKQEKKRITKPAHLDLMRRPLTTSRLDAENLDDVELQELNEMLGAGVLKRNSKSGSGAGGGAGRKIAAGLDDDEDLPDLLLEGQSIVANDPGQFDNLERSALIVRTERIARHQRQVAEERRRQKAKEMEMAKEKMMENL